MSASTLPATITGSKRVRIAAWHYRRFVHGCFGRIASHHSTWRPRIEASLDESPSWRSSVNVQRQRSINQPGGNRLRLLFITRLMRILGVIDRASPHPGRSRRAEPWRDGRKMKGQCLTSPDVASILGGETWPPETRQKPARPHPQGHASPAQQGACASFESWK
ncbi:hypothetical protein BKA56DRAFT_322714 [Ilyonectria sp. MPI-CAGE-AT-0026]|nr:hypothetical protein BKA56DRAFT_322714 [Ilyonectria sp. MPI-CAGE-AT-0026]